jgi:hypothetical protein
MSHKEKVILHVLIGFVGYTVWALMAFFDPSLRHDFLVFNVGMATGTIGLALRNMKDAADTSAVSAPSPVAVEQAVMVCGRQTALPPASPMRPESASGLQAGFARLSMMMVMALCTLAVLSACSLVPQNVSAVQEGGANGRPVVGAHYLPRYPGWDLVAPLRRQCGTA